ncbi:hemolysin-like protein [Salmonella enterica subsp. enterica]|nr:hemolysin-like protein [Salmonella enterica subsp. enterica]
MSDDNSHSSDTVNSKKGFFSLLLSQLFHGEPKNRDELLALIRDSGQNELIDEDTRDMLEGVMDIADQRVRDIMIPRSPDDYPETQPDAGRMSRCYHRVRPLAFFR